MNFFFDVINFILAMKFRDLPRGEESSVKFLQERGLLPSIRECQNGHPMKLYYGQRVFWQCNVKACRQKINMRKDNWFQVLLLLIHLDCVC
jgi:hypothetical protein